MKERKTEVFEYFTKAPLERAEALLRSINIFSEAGRLLLKLWERALQLSLMLRTEATQLQSNSIFETQILIKLSARRKY